MSNTKFKKFQELKGKKVDVTPLFELCGIDAGHIEIIETEGMYPYKENVEDNWAYFIAVGMKRLKAQLGSEGRNIEDIGIVGIGSGVEGIAAMHVLQDSLKRLIVTDIDEEILEGAVLNMTHGAEVVEVDVIPLVGSFCEPMYDAGHIVDVVHANIPNLPATGAEDLSQGAEKGTFVPTQLYDVYNPPEKFVAWALGAQYAYLESAKKIVRNGGTIITELGGRMPTTFVKELFDACDLEFQEVVNGFKEQTEALIDFIGYHRMEEKHGVSFEFYRYSESKNLLDEKGIDNPTHEIGAEELKNLLAPYVVSAGEALELYHQGIPVGHTVHLFRGIKR